MKAKKRLYNAYRRMIRLRRIKSRKLTPAGSLVFNALVICAVVGLNTDTSLIYQLFALLLCLYLFARIAIKFNQPDIALERRLPRYATAHEPFSYRIDITNNGDSTESDLSISDLASLKIPSLEVFLTQAEPFESSRNAYDRFIGFHRFMYLTHRATGILNEPVSAPPIAIGEKHQLSITATPLRRGKIHFSSMNLFHPDPFNLVQGVTNYPRQDLLIVLPRRYSLSANLVLAGRQSQQSGSRSQGRAIGESDTFISMRDYRVGDAFKKIHWASSAKRNKPVIREYQDEFTPKVRVMLLTQGADVESAEQSISIAASLLDKLSEQCIACELVTDSAQSRPASADGVASNLSQQLESLALIDLACQQTIKPCDLLTLKKTLQSKRRNTSYLFMVLAAWSDQHENLVQHLQASGGPSTLLLVTESKVLTLPTTNNCRSYHVDTRDVEGALAAI